MTRSLLSLRPTFLVSHRGADGLLATATLGCVLAVSSCAPKLEPISELASLRVLGVRKSAPYAHPGEEVTLQLRWEDGREDLPEVETFFGFWCVNPVGGAWAGCLTPDQPSREPQLFLNEETVTVTIPEGSVLPNENNPDFPAYGSAFVFHAVCAGSLKLDALEDATDFDAPASALLPKCVDEEGNELGSADFIVGFSQIFLFEELRNQNPIVTGFSVDGAEVLVDCIDAECQEPFDVPELQSCQEGSFCIKPCEDDGEFTCPEVRISALIDESSAEKDELAQIAYGTDLDESIWVSYFVDRGGISSPVKLVNDSDLGWQASFSTGLLAPKDEGPLRIWAVARDNRGGASWVRLGGYVEAE